MAVINWDESKPAGTDSLGQGDDEIRSLKTAIRTGLGSEHIWPAAGGDAGVHQFGSARPYVGTQSLVSSTGTDGRVMWASDSSRFFHVGSGGTAFIGGPTVLSMASFPGTVPQRHYWALEFGIGVTSVSGTTVVLFPSAYSGAPIVLITPAQNADVTVPVYAIGSASFGASSYGPTGAATGSITFNWLSIGTRVL